MEEVSSEYILQDDNHRLKSQVNQLKLLVDKQSETIRNLKQESLDKSRRILELEQYVQIKTKVTTQTDSVFTPKLQLTGVVSSARTQYWDKESVTSQAKPVSQGNLESSRLAEKNIILLQDEREYWRRHFEEADTQVRKLKKILEAERLLRPDECKQKYLARHSSVTDVDEKSDDNYIKSLLQENYDLKEKLSKITIKGLREKELNDRVVDKENIENQDLASSNGISQPSRFSAGSKSQPARQQGNQKKVLSAKPASVQQSETGTRTSKSFEQTRRTNSYASVPKPPVRTQSLKSQDSTKQVCRSDEQNDFTENIEYDTLATDSHKNVDSSIKSQVGKLREELLAAAADVECCCCHSRDSKHAGSNNTKSYLSAPSMTTKSAPTKNAKSTSYNNTKSSTTQYPKSLTSNTKTGERKCSDKCAGQQNVCYRCKKLTCRNETGVKFDEEIDPTTVHLCQHIRCLQRQVCHLQHRLSCQGHELTGLRAARSSLSEVTCQLQRANQEISSLRCANAELCKTRSNCEQENEMLKTKLETLMSEISENDKVKKLVENIETQRDRYKSHMENLLQDIQNNKGKTSPNCSEEDTESETPQQQQKSSLKQMKINQDKRRVNFTGVDLLHADQEEENDSCTTTDTLDEVSRLQNELHNARMEIHKLRRELMDTLTRPSGQGKSPNDSPSKPSIYCPPNSGAEHANYDSSQDLAAERNRLNAEREIIELQRAQIRNEKMQRAQSEQEREVRNKNSVPLTRSKSTPTFTQEKSVDENQNEERDRFDCTTEMANLKKRIYFLEKQLENTENALRTNQNLVAENSERTYKQSTELLELKQALNQANRTAEELRTMLERKDDMLRRVTDEKNQLFNQLSAQKDRNAALSIDLAESKERCSHLKRDLEKLERKSFEESDESVRREERLDQRLAQLRNMEKLREQDSNASSQLQDLREDYSKLSEELQSQRDYCEDLSSKLEQANQDINNYIDKVKSLETLLSEKENERRILLGQYEQLSRDLHKVETINRNLEMQAENMSLEVRSKQADLEAVKAKCEHSDQYIESMIRSNEQLKTQIISLNAKVEMLTADLQENRITRDQVLDDLNGVNELAVKLNTDKVELLHKISEQNNEVEKLTVELCSLKQELLGALATAEDEKHRSKTLEKLVTESTEVRETVIKELRRETHSNDDETSSSKN